MIHFDVDFYQQKGVGKASVNILADHESLFNQQLSSKQFITNLTTNKLKQQGVDIDEIDFIIYALFRHQNSSSPIYDTFNSISALALYRIPDFDGFYEFGSTVKNSLTQFQNGADKTYAEYQGVSGTLVLNNILFGLTNADYIGIPITKQKNLDFQLNVSSVGTKLIILESKGTFGVDTNISSKANDIINKKKKQGYINNTRDLYYGVITRIPYQNESGNAKCTIVDPDFPELDIDPLKFKIFARLNYYINKIGLLVHSTFREKLIKLLEYLQTTGYNWKEQYENQIYNLELKYSVLPTNFKCTYISIIDDVIIGKTFATKKNELFFYGLRESLFKKLENPTIKNLSSIQYKEESLPELQNIILKYEIKDRSTFHMKEVIVSGKLKFYSTGEVVGFFYHNSEIPFYN